MNTRARRAPLRPPFPWFGGKRRVGGEVWERLGDVAHYIEPFAGGAAVLLARHPGHEARVETLNDADALVVNAWRAMRLEPGELAKRHRPAAGVRARRSTRATGR